MKEKVTHITTYSKWNKEMEKIKELLANKEGEHWREKLQYAAWQMRQEWRELERLHKETQTAAAQELHVCGCGYMFVEFVDLGDGYDRCPDCGMN